MSQPDPSPASPPAGAPISVHKFGGSSLADADRFRRVAATLARETGTRQVVIASAMYDVTNSLRRLLHAAETGRGNWRVMLDELADVHVQTVNELLSGHRRRHVTDWLQEQIQIAREVLTSVVHLGAGIRLAWDFVRGMGETLSSRILAEYLGETGRPFAWMDSRDVIHLDFSHDHYPVDWDRSAGQLAAWQTIHGRGNVVASGFVATDGHGHACLLGANGSDFSAAIYASLFKADKLTLWGTTAGLMSADPEQVPEAFTLPELSYEEASELAFFGARVIHSRTMIPAMARDLPIHVRDSRNPDLPGTVIHSGARPGRSVVRGLSLISDAAIINIEGDGMIGTHGTADYVFGALERTRVSARMISQGSSEHSICCVVDAEEAEIAVRELQNIFESWLVNKQLDEIRVERDISVLAVVGDGMTGRPGVAARLLSALARSHVNVRAIAQGSSERNISVAVASADATRALRAAHAAFLLSPRCLQVGIIGSGNVGAALIEQLRAAMPRLRREDDVDIQLQAVANSRKMMLDVPTDDDWRTALEAGQPLDLDAFTEAVSPPHLPHAMIIDCSASDAVAGHYAGWLARGIHVVTPNKHAGAGDLERWRAIRHAGRRSHTRFRYEATVGAGLPVIQTLRDLIDTGDDIIAIDGILSGTMAWLFNRWDGKQPFSELLREAHAMGYTEPDPRDDLSGMDVARKLVILARETGRELTLDDVAVESLVPPELGEVSREDFLSRIAVADERLAERHAAAAARGKVLRYVARLDATEASVALRALPATHAFAGLRLTDNIVQFTTRRYRDNPLIVQGPGAGPDVTAGGVFADLLRVVSGLGDAP